MKPRPVRMGPIVAGARARARRRRGKVPKVRLWMTPVD